MTSSEKLIEDIEQAIMRPELVGRLRMEGLAREYATRCATLKANFARAVSNVRAGCCCEADRFAKEERLFEEFKTLRFANAEKWRKICAKENYDIPIELLDDNVAELRLFTLDYDAVRDVFTLNRRQALERAPLNERMKTIKQIVKAFPDQKCWRDDFYSFKDAREKNSQSLSNQ